MATKKTAPSVIVWNEEEWRLIAAELIKSHPERELSQARTIDEVKLGTPEILVAMRAVLPQERHRTLKDRGRTCKQLLPHLQALPEPEPQAEVAAAKPAAKKAAPAHLLNRDDHVHWSNSEWDALLQALIAKEPKYRHAKGLEKLFVSEFHAVMRSALPPERHRKIAWMTPVRKVLIQAQRRLPQAALAQKAVNRAGNLRGGAPIRWSEAEWRSIAQALIQLQPKYRDTAMLVDLSLRMVNQAIQQAIAPERQRILIELANPRKFLAQVIPALVDDMPEAAPVTLATIAAAVLPAPVAPVLAAPAAEAAAPPATRQLLAKPGPSGLPRLPDGQNTGAPKAKTFWRPLEYKLMAQEMLRVHPAGRWFDNEDLATMQSRDVVGAMRVLNTDRRRPASALKSVAPLKPHFVAAFKELKQDIADYAAAYEAQQQQLAAEREQEEQQKLAQEQEQQLREQQAEQQRIEALAAERAAQLHLEARRQLEQAPPPELARNVLERQDSGTLLSMLMGRGLQAIENMLTNVVTRAFSSPVVQQALSRPQPLPSAPPRNAYVAPRHNPEPREDGTAAPRLPVVCVAGALKAHHMQEVRDEFKDRFEVRFYHPHEAAHLLASRARNASHTILMTDHISHSVEESLKSAHVPYLRTPGTISKVKELIFNLPAA